MKNFALFTLAGATAGAFMTMPASAAEGGGSTYPSGVENFLAAAVPPPGFYIVEFANLYHANALKDNGGKSLPIPGFKVRAAVSATRFIWSSPYQVLGGNLVLASIVPVVDLDVKAGGQSQHKFGVGDITFGGGIATHYSEKLHTMTAVDFVAPVGGYDKNDLANIGRNYWSMQPLLGITYVQPTGFNGDVKFTFNFNQKNAATQYRSGNEIFVDYAAGYGLGNGWALGVSGHARRQFSDDEVNGVEVSGAKASAFAIGPSLRYDNGKGWFITAKLQRETSVRNGTQGTALWLKTRIPF